MGCPGEGLHLTHEVWVLCPTHLFSLIIKQISAYYRNMRKTEMSIIIAHDPLIKNSNVCCGSSTYLVIFSCFWFDFYKIGTRPHAVF